MPLQTDVHSPPTEPAARQSRARARSVLRWLPVLLFALAVGCQRGEPGEGDAQAKEGDKAPEAVPVEVAVAEQRAISASYSGTAPLEAPAESQVVAKTSGVALAVMVEEGDAVRAGQTLLRLDADRARLQAAQAAAQVAKLQNQFARAQKLVEEQLIAASDYDQIRYDLENARAAHRLAVLEVSYAEVKAPISGVVASVTPKPGNFVQINTPVVRIVDTSRLEATLNVPERELATMRAGLPVALRVDALPGRTFEGVVDRVAPVVDAGSGTFRVIAAFGNGGLLQPGMFGRISIDFDQRADALAVPRAALLDVDEGNAVFAVRDGKAARTEVQIGTIDGEWVEVRDGLAAGDRVVVAGKSALRDGATVSVIGDEPADDPAGAQPTNQAATAATGN
jgi:membrane fusion protein (multidrug efflux system)